MTEQTELSHVEPDRVFDSGNLDCGSGLVLLIRENMLQVPAGGILELRSREATVRDDLPPWCRMVGHAYLGSLEAGSFTRHFVRRGAESEKQEKKALAEDKSRAREYRWRARVRSTGHLKSTVYCRNFSFQVGQPASFEERDSHPSAVEYLLGALAADLCTGLASECARRSIELDDVEISIYGSLANVLAHLGLEEGDPSFSGISLKCYASTLEDEEQLRLAWDSTVSRSPLAATLGKAVELQLTLAIV